MEESPGSRFPSHVNSERKGYPHKANEDTYTKGDQTFEGEGVEHPPNGRRTKKESSGTQDGCQQEQVSSTRQSQVGKENRNKRQRSPDGSPCHFHRTKRNFGGKWHQQPCQVQKRGKNGTDPTRAGCHSRRAGSADITQHLKDSRTKPRASVRSTGRRLRRESQNAQSTSLKNCQHMPPEFHGPVSHLISRLFTHLDSLAVALGELQAPGGAFLPVFTRGMVEPSVSQRAWLSWQLAHAGAAMHWAVVVVDALLAAQPWPLSALPPSWPPPQGW
ncbi:uncharacterized protein LOC143662015 isoform X2 [Tamandua tetradactyla]|uniref:uncharacterized protein LOC143662015 isoform X2 n=1 Tax=Tamandua tetradactyla TaxID=48850 RepID=UPI004053F076